MKLRVKMTLMTVVPLIVLSLATVLLGSQKIDEVATEIARHGMEGVAYATRADISVGKGNDYWVDENNKLQNSDVLNITDSTENADTIKKNTNMEITVFYGDTRYMTTIVDANGERIIGTKASGAVIEHVLQNGESYFTDNVDIEGEAFYGFYIPMYNADSNTPVGMVFTGMSRDNVKAEINQILAAILGIALVVTIICVVVVMFIVNSITRGVKMGVNALEEVAHGNLTVEIDEKVARSKDEIGDLGRSVIALKKELVDIVGDIVRKSDDVHESATVLGEGVAQASEAIEQIERAIGEISGGATAQANDTQQATDNVVTMGNMVEETNNNAAILHDASNEMEKLGMEAANILKELEDINNKAKESIDVIYEQTNTTNESARKIGEAVNLITEIAEETNLLSLNASIEAARAGEQGRGFAVVAAQIQKLAEQSSDSAKQIEDIINSLMADSEKAVATMEVVNDIMKQQSEKVDQTDKIFGEVIEGIGHARDGVAMIADNTKQLDEARKVVVDIVSNLSAIAEENAASSQETSASTTEVSASMNEMSNNANNLKNIADTLKTSVSVFKV